MTLRSMKVLKHCFIVSRGGFLTTCRQGLKVSALSPEELEKGRESNLHKNKDIYKENEVPNTVKDKEGLDAMRTKFPDFLPDPSLLVRDKIREKLERKDMYRRRSRIQIPEFYVGSIVAVTVSDQHSPGKTSRFLGICIDRCGHGLNHCFTLRNVIDKQGIEVTYDMYSPLLKSIEVIRLEKRLDDQLYYLRDCPPEYSTFQQNLEPEPMLEGHTVRVNDIKVPLNPRPWSERWERADLKGIQEIEYKNERVKKKLMKLKELPQNKRPWEKEDIVKHYRETINPVDAMKILTEVMNRKNKKWKD